MRDRKGEKLKATRNREKNCKKGERNGFKKGCRCVEKGRERENSQEH